MPVPEGSVPTNNVDSGSDDPSKARIGFLNLIRQFNALIASVGQASGIASLGSNGRVTDDQMGRGQANGVAPLNNNSKIPVDYIPPTGGLVTAPTRYTSDGYTGNSRGIETQTVEIELDNSGLRLHVHTTYYDRS